MKSKFQKIYESSINNPEKFWKEISNDIFWFKKPTKILNKSNPPFYKWFEDGVTNTCYNALDYHIDQHDYQELFPHFLAHTEAMRNTGQLPKFEEDMYYIPSDNLFCIPKLIVFSPGNYTTKFDYSFLFFLIENM